MNILAQIVPGIRETRTPIAIGVLWAVAAWIGSFIVPSALFKSDLVRELGDQLKHIPSEARIALAILLIYVLGVFFEAIGHVLLAIFRGFVWVSLFVLGLGLLAIFVLEPQGALFYIALAVVVVLFQAMWRYVKTTVARASFWIILKNVVMHDLQRVGSWLAELIDTARQRVEPDFGMFQDLVSDEFEVYLSTRPNFLTSAVDELDFRFLLRAVEHVPVSSETLAKHANPEDRAEILRQRRLSEWLQGRRETSHDNRDIRAALLESLSRNPDSRRHFASHCLDLRVLRRLLRDRVERSIVHLRSEQAELYSEYDRLKSEGDFRSGIAAPISVLLATLGYRWNVEVGKGYFLTTVCIIFAAVIVGAILDRTGTVKTKKAMRLLYSCIRANLIVAQPQETIDEQVCVRRSHFTVIYPSIEKESGIRSPRRFVSDYLHRLATRIEGVNAYRGAVRNDVPAENSSPTTTNL